MLVPRGAGSLAIAGAGLIGGGVAAGISGILSATLAVVSMRIGLGTCLSAIAAGAGTSLEGLRGGFAGSETLVGLSGLIVVFAGAG